MKLGRPTPVTDEPDSTPTARASDARRSAPGRVSSPLEDVVRAPVPTGPADESARWTAMDDSPVGR